MVDRQSPATMTLPVPLPPPFATSTSQEISTHSQTSSSPSIELISQGAEALLLKTPYLSFPSAALKYRPPKPYRHPTLDKRLTRQRILAEARILVRCAKDRVPVPILLGLGAEEGWLMISWIDGLSVKEELRAQRDRARGSRGIDGSGHGQDASAVLRMVGAAVGKLHAAGIVHGDLTTSNMILQPTEAVSSGEEGPGHRIVLIDFGLAQIAVQEEERAVDLYVLERAFGSTHPEIEEAFAKEVLGAYGTSYKGAKQVVKRLEDVRMRGRKKSMLG